MAKQCKDANITISKAEKQLKVLLDGELILQSANALALKEGSYPVRYYFPRADIGAELLSASDHTSHCPYKGDASYHHLKGANAMAQNAVWYYPDPCPLVEQVQDHLSFWGDRIEIV